MPRSDAVFIKKATVQDGLSTGSITTGALIATRKYLFVLPANSVTSQGSEILNARYTLSGRSLPEAAQALFDDRDVEISTLEENLKALLVDEPVQRIFVLSSYPDFKVQDGLFGTCSLAFQAPGENLLARKVVAVNKKEDARALKAFFQGYVSGLAQSSQADRDLESRMAEAASIAEKKRQGNPVWTIFSGVLLQVLAIYFYFDLSPMELEGGTRKVHTLVAFLYDMLGLWGVCGGLAALGVLLEWFGIRSWLKNRAAK